MSTISVVPAPGNPLTDSQSAYNTKTLAFAQALPTLGTEINTVVGEIVDQVALLDAAVDSASESADAATTQAGVAATQAGIATTKAAEAAASALSAINSPGTSATSTTSLTIGDGAKSLTVQTGKSLAVGQFLLCAYTPAPENYMVGQVLSYNSGSGALTLNIVYAGGSGTYAAWTLSLTAARSGAAEGGADITVSATGFSLLASSGRVQSVTFTAANQNIVLPDATTLATGGEIFVINNTGAHSAYVRKPSGSGVVKVPPNTSALLYLSDNTTADGVWASGLLTQSTALALGTILTVNSVDSSFAKSITKLTDTSAVVAWRESTTLKSCVLTVDGLGVDVGSIVTIDTSVYHCSVCRLSDSQALLFYSGNATASRACTLNISGSSVTAGTILSVDALKGSNGVVSALTSTTALAVHIGTSNVLQGYVLTVSGTSVSKSTEQLVYNGAPGNISVCTFTPTLAVVSYIGVSSYLKAVTVTISGTTLTANSVLSVNSVASNYPALAALDEETAILSYAASAALQSVPLTLSGTNLVSGSVVTTGALTAYEPATARLSPTKALVLWDNNAVNFQAGVISLGDGVLSSVTPIAVGGTNVIAYCEVCALTETRGIAVFSSMTSNYLQAVVLEVL